jgi:tRNA A37 threonylcarbamoyltransferase TsaD
MNTASSTLGNAPDPVQKLLNLLYTNPKKMEHLAESLKPKEEKPIMKVDKDGNFSLTL